VPVNVTSWPVTYVYHKTDLFITYGFALFSALGCSILGLYAFSANHNSSYQNTFSTFLRATYKMDVRSKIRRGDVGADPLPQRLGKADVEFPQRLWSMITGLRQAWFWAVRYRPNQGSVA
jgi:hypothetical protein